MKKHIFLFFLIYLILLSVPLISFNNLNHYSDIKNIFREITLNQNQKTKTNYETNNNPNDINRQSEINKSSKLTQKEKSQINELSEIIFKAKNKQSLNDINETNQKEKVIKSDGYFNILNIKTGIIERVSEKDYVIGAVCAEMPPTFHPEALKAQAISAHTYALKMKQEQMRNPDNNLKGADFSANPYNWEKYVTKDIAKKRYNKKFEEYWNNIESAVNGVIDIIMVYNNEPIIAAYHAISSGKTESAHDVWGGNAPYLLPVDSYGDKFAPDFKTNVCFSSQELKQILINNFSDLKLSSDPSNWFNNIVRSDSGSVLNVNIDNQNISGSQIRTAFNLRSANFLINYDDQSDIFNFIVKGYGHDVGLSQYGANYMANNGADFKKILNHYYNNISFVYIS